MKKFLKKPVAIILAVVLLVGAVVGSTLAWLTDSTNTVVNTFTTSTIDVELGETTNNYQMIPGWTIDKNPKAKITANSTDAFLFVKVTSNNTITLNEDGTYSVGAYLDYAIDAQWTLVPGTENVFYIENPTKDTEYNVLGEGKRTYESVEYTWADNKVLVKPTVTKAMMDALVADNPETDANESTYPTLVFTAYATQLKKDNTNNFSAADAWALVNP